MLTTVAGAVLVALSVLVYVLTLPRWLVRAVSQLVPSILFDVPTSEKIIAMTIDDSPSPTLTREILKVLKKHECKATFFIIGSQAEQCPGVLKELQAEGHELANHTMYDRASFRLPPDELELQLDACEELISNCGSPAHDSDGHQRQKWFRPGHGWVTPGMLDLCKRKGYRLTLGSVFGNDPWVKSPALLKWYYTRWAYPGAIMILHDGVDPTRHQTVEILDTVLPRLKKQGYKITTVSDLYLASGRVSKVHAT